MPQNARRYGVIEKDMLDHLERFNPDQIGRVMYDGLTAPPFSPSPSFTISSKEKAEPLLFHSLYRKNNTGFVVAVRCFSPLKFFDNFLPPAGSRFGAGDRRGANDPKTATNQKIPWPFIAFHASIVLYFDTYFIMITICISYLGSQL